MADMKMLMACLAMAGFLAACGQTAVESETPPAETPAATTPPDPNMPVAPVDASAGPSGTDNKTWTFDPMGRTHEGVSRPRLMYHNGGSDSWFMNIQCDPGTNNAYLLSMRDGDTGSSWRFTLQSGAARAELTATALGDGPSSGEVGASAPVALDAPVMAAFRSTGALTQIEDGRSFVSDAINDAERATIAQFFTACS
jgi:hypothetical protein